MITRILTALGVLAGAHFAQAASVTVFAAASLYSALDAIEVEFEAATGIDLVVSFAGSSALARQIQQGAPADIFIFSKHRLDGPIATRGFVDPGNSP